MTISDTDITNYSLIRKNIEEVYKTMANLHDSACKVILDVAPQTHKGTKEFFKHSLIETLDIDTNSDSTFICDICNNNSHIIVDEKYDLIFCMEVLEHVVNPFSAALEIYRLLKKGGTAIISTPFNFRIHNPLPDNWRFTEHGLRVLFKDFDHIQVTPLNDEQRFLMPIHYITTLKK